jgi:ribA/ribD-fused uncharacterized protein
MKLKTNMSLSGLRKQIQEGQTFEYEFFWRGPLSQWERQGFTVEGVYYKTAEHWMMAEKAHLFGDEETRKQILAADHPKRAKELGRQVHGFNEDKWVNNRYNIVYNGNSHKFSQSDEYRNILLATGDKILVEASPVDQIWGIGLAEDDPDALDPLKWKGLNLLGFVLTDLKNDLKRR